MRLEKVCIPIALSLALMIAASIVGLQTKSFANEGKSEGYTIPAAKDSLFICKATVELEDSLFVKFSVADIDGDGNNEMVIHPYGHATIFTYASGKFVRVLTIPAKKRQAYGDEFVSDVAIARLDGKTNYLITTDMANERTKAYVMKNGKLIEKDALKHPQSSYVEAVADFSGRGRDELVIRDRAGAIVTWRDNKLAIWKDFPLQHGFLYGDFVGLGRAQLASVGYARGFGPIYVVSAFQRDGKRMVIWKGKLLPETRVTLRGNPRQIAADINGDGKKEILVLLEEGDSLGGYRNASSSDRFYVMTFQESGNAYRSRLTPVPKYAWALNGKSAPTGLEEFLLSLFPYALGTPGDLFGDGRQEIVNFRHSAGYCPFSTTGIKEGFLTLQFARYENGRWIAYRSDTPKWFQPKVDGTSSLYYILGCADLDRDGRDEIFIRVDEKDGTRLEVYGLNPRYFPKGAKSTGKFK